MNGKQLSVAVSKYQNVPGFWLKHVCPILFGLLQAISVCGQQ